LVKLLKSKRPETPIILVEDRVYTNAWITPAKRAFHQANHAALREAYEKLVAEGISGLSYIPGDDLLGQDGEGATDGSHPNDLGFMRQAEAFLPHLKKVLGR
jgi:lysophospholipase L1-like esterase